MTIVPHRIMVQIKSLNRENTTVPETVGSIRLL